MWINCWRNVCIRRSYTQKNQRLGDFFIARHLIIRKDNHGSQKRRGSPRGAGPAGSSDFGGADEGKEAPGQNRVLRDVALSGRGGSSADRAEARKGRGPTGRRVATRSDAFRSRAGLSTGLAVSFGKPARRGEGEDPMEAVFGSPPEEPSWKTLLPAGSSEPRAPCERALRGALGRSAPNQRPGDAAVLSGIAAIPRERRFCPG